MVLDSIAVGFTLYRKIIQVATLFDEFTGAMEERGSRYLCSGEKKTIFKKSPER